MAADIVEYPTLYLQYKGIRSRELLTQAGLRRRRRGDGADVVKDGGPGIVAGAQALFAEAAKIRQRSGVVRQRVHAGGIVRGV